MSTTNKTRKTAARAIADVTTGTILATVEIAVPPERVFQALTTEEMTRWWGSPELYQTTGWTGDVRPGGRWRADGRGADGAPFFVEGEYLEVEPPRKIVQTWVAAWDGGNTTTITYTIDAVDGGTRVMVRHEGFAGRSDSCRGHANGWERVLGWLDGHLGSAPAAPAVQKFFLCRLLGPRPTFPADITDAERLLMRAHAAYWTDLIGKGTAIVFGPVADPKGVWGLGVLRVASEDEAQTLVAHDPTVLSGQGFRFETLPMLSAIAGG